MYKILQTIWALAAMAFAANLAAQTQAPDLDELQRQLDSATAQEARAAEAVRRDAAARAAQQARLATLVIRTDAACDLHIDGENKGRLKPDAPRTLEVIGGKQLLECTSSEEAGVSVETIAEIAAGSKDIVTLELASRVAALRAQRESEKQAQIAAQQQREREAAAAQQAIEAKRAYLSRWQDRGNGVLTDSQTGLEWAQRDNGKDVNWKQARSYCEGLRLDGMGWRLPTVDELQSAHSPHADYVSAGSYQVRVSPLFRLTSFWFWSGTQDGSSSAFFVSLDGGGRFSGSVSYSVTSRALCVRRRS